MDIKIINNFISFVKECNAYSKELNKYPYRISSVKKNQKDEYVFIIEIKGTNSAFKIKAETLLSGTKRIKHFAWYDIRTICYYAFADELSPKYRDISFCFDKNNNGLIKGRQRGEKKIREVNINTHLSEELLKSLQPELAVAEILKCRVFSK